jgi:hypothetical protein
LDLATTDEKFDYEVARLTDETKLTLLSSLAALTLKGQCRPTGLVLFWENLVQNFYSIAPNEVFRMPNRAP